MAEYEQWINEAQTTTDPDRLHLLATQGITASVRYWAVWNKHVRDATLEEVIQNEYDREVFEAARERLQCRRL